MTTNTPLTTAEAMAILDCSSHTQLYRWRAAGYLKGKRYGRMGAYRWDPDSVQALAEQIGPRQEGHARRVKLPS